MTSPDSLRTVLLQEDTLDLIVGLREPKSEKDLFRLGRRCGLDVPTIESLVELLTELHIIWIVNKPKTFRQKQRHAAVFQSQWWDQNDLAYIDIRMHQTLQVLYGNAKSLCNQFPVSREGSAIPWFSYPAIEFLEQLDLSRTEIFEYGSGASTLYFASRCKKIVSVEHNLSWHAKITKGLPGHSSVMLATQADDYSTSIYRSAQLFDLIVIDAAPQFRNQCAAPAIDCLKPDGAIILDDASCYPYIAETLTRAGLIRIDLIGPAPLEFHVQCTALFVTRDFNPRRKSAIYQPTGSPYWVSPE